MCRSIVVTPVSVHSLSRLSYRGPLQTGLTDLFHNVWAADYTPLSCWVYVTASPSPCCWHWILRASLSVMELILSCQEQTSAAGDAGPQSKRGFSMILLNLLRSCFHYSASSLCSPEITRRSLGSNSMLTSHSKNLDSFTAGWGDAYCDYQIAGHLPSAAFKIYSMILLCYCQNPPQKISISITISRYHPRESSVRQAACPA